MPNIITGNASTSARERASIREKNYDYDGIDDYCAKGNVDYLRAS